MPPQNFREMILELKKLALTTLPPSASLAEREETVLAIGRQVQTALMEELTLEGVVEPETSQLPCPCGQTAHVVERKKKRRR